MKNLQLPQEEAYEGEWEDIALDHTIQSCLHWIKTTGRKVILAASGAGMILFFTLQ